MFELNRYKQHITIEGISYSRAEILSAEIPDFANHSSFHKDVYIFLKEWLSESETILLQTSGSTGSPKEIIAEKEQMMQSAVLTCNFLDLKKADKTLLCLPLSSIAGKMIVVRTLIAGLDLYLITPCGNPLKYTEITFQFAAMVPLQVFNSLQNEMERSRLKLISNLIIGGGSIDYLLEKELKLFPNNIYSTYGMTETLSHIALRQINGIITSVNYIPFPSVKLSLSKDDCLIIDAPLISKEVLHTNDIANIYPDGSFRILGRKDNTINSGGIKIQIEEVEEKLKTFIQFPFAITSLPDPKFGEIVVMLSEQIIDKKKMEELLNSYQIPKEIILVDSIPMTRTSKIDRLAVKKLAEEKSNVH